MAARRVALAAGLLILSLSLAACGGGGAKPPVTTEPANTQPSASGLYAQRLSAACTAMRKQIEALGKPSDTPISKVYPGTVKIGRAFLRQVKQLVPPPGAKPKVTAMLREYGYYFDGLGLAYALLTKRHSQQGFIQTAAAADANLNLAVGDARKLGAAACARQPFS
jgi:hypothetical protein